jgi:Golgi apparatus protein 1
MIAILSIAVPVIAICAIAVVICMKKKRKREQEKDDAEARKQNEQNQSHISHLQQHHHNSMAAIKRSSNSASTLDQTHHQVIKNTWDKSVNNVMSNSMSLDDSCGVLNTSLYGGMSNYSDHTTSSGQTGGVILTNGGMECFQAQILPQTLQRAKSQKQLNTDPALMHRASQILSQHQPAKELGLDKRISVLSDAQLCNTRWSVQQAASNRPLVGPCSPPHM